MTDVHADQTRRYFFVHVMKTGGSSFRRRLMNHFGERAVYPTAGVDGADPVTLKLSVDHLRAQLAARGDQIQVISGHFPLSTVELLEGRYTTMTLLREPVERTLSFLRQQRRDNVRAGRRRSLTELYDDGMLHNQMTMMLSWTPSEMAEMSRKLFKLSQEPPEAAGEALGRLACNRGHLERAKEALAGIDAFGVQERLEDFCDELSSRFGWRLGDSVSLNTTEPVEVPESLRARIAEDSALDVELYEFASELLASGGPRADPAEAGIAGVGR